MSSTTTYLNKQFENFEEFTQGTLGVHALHIETGLTVSYKENESFLMCSTYKIPMAILLLNQVEQKTIVLNSLYSVTEFDLRPGAVFTLNQFDYEVPLTISLRNLLQLMLQESCNTSTDILLRTIGGPTLVTKWLR